MTYFFLIILHEHSLSKKVMQSSKAQFPFVQLKLLCKKIK